MIVSIDIGSATVSIYIKPVIVSIHIGSATVSIYIGSASDTLYNHCCNEVKPKRPTNAKRGLRMLKETY